MGPDELTQLVVGGEAGSADGRACFGDYFFGLGLPLVDGAVAGAGAGLLPPVRRTGGSSGLLDVPEREVGGL